MSLHSPKETAVIAKSTSSLALGSRSGIQAHTCPPPDTPRGLGQGYLFVPIATERGARAESVPLLNVRMLV